MPDRSGQHSGPEVELGELEAATALDAGCGRVTGYPEAILWTFLVGNTDYPKSGTTEAEQR